MKGPGFFVVAVPLVVLSAHLPGAPAWTWQPAQRRAQPPTRRRVSSLLLRLPSSSITSTATLVAAWRSSSATKWSLAAASSDEEASFGPPNPPVPVRLEGEAAVPQIQPIQPSMQEAPLYADPPASMSIQQPSSGPTGSSADGEVPLNTFNGRPMTSTNNMIEANRPPGYMGTDQERIQGDSLRTYDNPLGGTGTSVDLKTQGRPIHADLQMWAGPDNVPKSVKLYSQDGSQYGIGTSFSTANTQRPNSVSIRNQANMEFPLTARVTSASPAPPSANPSSQELSVGVPPQPASPPQVPRAIEHEGGVLIQGEGMVKTFPIAANMQKVQIILQSSAMTGNRRLPVMAKVELLQGPNNVKTCAEIYDDGLHGDYFETVFDTPGFSSSIRITNTGPMTYPFHVLVLPHTFGDPKPLANDVNDVSQSRFGPDGRFRG